MRAKEGWRLAAAFPPMEEKHRVSRPCRGAPDLRRPLSCPLACPVVAPEALWRPAEAGAGTVSVCWMAFYAAWSRVSRSKSPRWPGCCCSTPVTASNNHGCRDAPCVV